MNSPPDDNGVSNTIVMSLSRPNKRSSDVVRVGGAKPIMSCTVSNVELVGDLAVSPTWGALGLSASDKGYDINPGNNILFPWPSQVAPAFEKYRFKRLFFRITSNAPVTTAGVYQVCVDPDIDDEVPVSAGTTLGNRISGSASIWQTMELEVPVKLLNDDMPHRFVTPGSGVEPRTTFAGFFFAGGVSNPGSVLSLSVGYTVELVCPQINLGNVSVFDVPTSQAVPYYTYGGLDHYPINIPNTIGLPVTTVDLFHAGNAISQAQALRVRDLIGKPLELGLTGTNATTPVSTWMGSNPSLAMFLFDAVGNFVSAAYPSNTARRTKGLPYNNSVTVGTTWTLNSLFTDAALALGVYALPYLGLTTGYSYSISNYLLSAIQ
jgi:hypothetical protein